MDVIELSGIMIPTRFLQPKNALDETLFTFCEKQKNVIEDAGGKQIKLLLFLLKRAPLSMTKKSLSGHSIVLRETQPSKM